MWSWFAPRCPVSTYEKAWLETRMCWLAERVPIDRLLQCEVLTRIDPSFLPLDNWQAVDRVIKFLATRIGVDPSLVEFEYCRDFQLSGIASPAPIAVQEDRIRVLTGSESLEAERLISRLVHGVSYAFLYNNKHLSLDDEEGLLLAELLAVFLGFGLFVANATVRDADWRLGIVRGWEMSRQGYVTSHMCGYALALFAHMRGEYSPSWGKLLRKDARESFVKGLAFLRSGGETAFDPRTIRTGIRTPTATESREHLERGAPSTRLIALWKLAEQPPLASDFEPLVVRALRDRESEIVAAAAKLVGIHGASMPEAQEELLPCLNSKHSKVQLEAVSALGALGLNPEIVVPELRVMLRSLSRDGDRVVIKAAAIAAGRFGREAAICAPFLLAHLSVALVKVDEELVQTLVEALVSVCDDPVTEIRERFPSGDEGLRRMAESRVEERLNAAVNDGDIVWE